MEADIGITLVVGDDERMLGFVGVPVSAAWAVAIAQAIAKPRAISLVVRVFMFWESDAA